MLKRLPDFVLLVGIAAAIGAILFFAWLANEVLEGDTQQFDEQIRYVIHQQAFPSLTWLMSTVTLLGAASVLSVLGFCVVLGFLFAGWRRAAVLFIITMAGAALLNIALKQSFQRTRPIPYFDLSLPASYSFPSGHAMLTFCFYGVLAALLTARLSSRMIRLGIWTGAACLVALVGLSRVYLGVHYPSDVLAGYAGALVWVLAVVIGDRALRRRQKGAIANCFGSET